MSVTTIGEMGARRTARADWAAFLAANPKACATCRGHGGTLMEAGAGLLEGAVIVDAAGRAIVLCPDCLGATRTKGGKTYRWPACGRCGAHVSPHDLGNGPADWPCGHQPLEGLAPTAHEACCPEHCPLCTPGASAPSCPACVAE